MKLRNSFPKIDQAFWTIKISDNKEFGTVLTK